MISIIMHIVIIRVTSTNDNADDDDDTNTGTHSSHITINVRIEHDTCASHNMHNDINIDSYTIVIL